MAKVNATTDKLRAMDKDKDGQVSGKEKRQAKRAAKKAVGTKDENGNIIGDTDGDGVLSKDEKKTAKKKAKNDVKNEFKNQKKAEKEGFKTAEEMKNAHEGTPGYGGTESSEASYKQSMADANAATDNYDKNAKAINDQYRNDMSSLTDYANQSVSDFQNQINSLRQDYQNTLDQYAGKNGYNNMMQQAQQGATQAAANAGSVAQGNARSMGMSKAASAAMGAGSVVNAYNQGLNAQQQQVGGMYNNMLAGAGNSMNAGINGANTALNGHMNIFGTNANAMGQIQSSGMQAAQNDVANQLALAQLAQNGRNNWEETFGSDGNKGKGWTSGQGGSALGQPTETTSDRGLKCCIEKMNTVFSNFGKRFRRYSDHFINL